MKDRISLSTQINNWASALAAISDSPRLDAEILLKHVSGFGDAQLVASSDEPLGEKHSEATQALIEARLQGTPIAYLIGRRAFYTLDLKVNRHVLIPRPETELLVDTALGFIHTLDSPRVLDLGTGSGAIALAIADQAPDAHITATDIDADALQLARENAVSHHLNKVSFKLSDWFAKLDHRAFDLIVSNPPYIDPDDPHLQRGDVRFEPRRALVSGQRGYDDLRKIIREAPTYLNAGGGIVLEHGCNQGRAVREMLAQTGFREIETRKDLNQLERVTHGIRDAAWNSNSTSMARA